MNKRPLTTTIVTHILRGAFFIALLFIAHQYDTVRAGAAAE